MTTSRKFNIQSKWLVLGAGLLIISIILAGGSKAHAAEITFPNHGSLDNIYNNQGQMAPSYPDTTKYTFKIGGKTYKNVTNPYNPTGTVEENSKNLITGLVSSNEFDNGYIRISDNFVKLSFSNTQGYKYFRLYNPGMYCVKVDKNGDGRNEACTYNEDKFYYQLCDLNGKNCEADKDKHTISKGWSGNIDIRGWLSYDDKHNVYSAGIKLSIYTPEEKIVANPYRVMGLTNDGDVVAGFMGPEGSSTKDATGKRMALRNNINNTGTIEANGYHNGYNWAHWYADHKQNPPTTNYKIRMTVPNNAPAEGEPLRLSWYDFDAGTVGNPSMNVSIIRANPKPDDINYFTSSAEGFLGASNSDKNRFFDGRTYNGVTLPKINVYPGDMIIWGINKVRFDNNIGLTLFYDGGVYPSANIHLAATSDSQYAEAGETVNFNNSTKTTTNSWGASYKYSYKIDGPASSSGTKYLNENVSSDSGSVVVPDLPLGSQYCREILITEKPDWATVTGNGKVCVTIGKKPKVQFWGGDLNVGGDVMTSTSIKNNHTFGSWAEYGIVAGGGINGAASGAAYAGPGLVVGLSANPLSFTNKDNTKNCNTSSIAATLTSHVGCYSNAISLPDMAGEFPDSSNSISGNISPDSLTSSGTYMASSDITLVASTLRKGKTIIIKAPNNTVTIANDQTYYEGPYASISDLPQLVIIAKNVVINDSVDRVDAWLVALSDGKGSIKTCQAEATKAGDCSTKLTVNGPVMTDKLYLYRTGGSGTGLASGEPAEVFNLRADAILWADARTNSNRYQTVYQTELPPRL